MSFDTALRTPFRWSGRLALALVLLAATACRPDRRPIKIIGPATTNLEADLGLDELRKSLESTVLENYSQLTFGNIEAFLDRVPVDRELQFVGVTPKDLVVGVDPPEIQEDRRLYRQRRLRMLSKNLDVHLSEDGSVGWVYDEVSYRVEYMGREASIPIRSTALYLRDVERWVLVAEHLSYGVPMDELIGMVARKKFRTNAKMESHHGTSKRLSISLVGIVGRFVNGSATEAFLPEGESALILLPGPELEFHGEHGLSAPSLAQTIGDNASVAIQSYRLELSSSKRVAWMVANLAARSELNGDPVVLPLRGTFILERRGKEGWLIAQAHISAGFSESELSDRVFGPAEDE